ncbi:mycofactocin system GMC family oxidoreductase MftG [Rhodococcus sp. IEGM 1408]|uniref:mycofactocin system GMC family oxidoreductase MftG n=1 Tax=Rhodococcus sp. IEGM 1408 TaxID=3082220 RepID=UPI0029543EA7|nr:mycofactocin system GMC family oxidoreductase MftG [Rhodococcus sp. IEGM 1408]MDV8001175.1 mycofactocin system GMC family oxidoreductase MftG [Rhodococcus sp. IEGM 1408]
MSSPPPPPPPPPPPLPQPRSRLPRAADVVVVGAGPAGCVMARRLAEAGADVILLEAGTERASSRAGLLDVGPVSRVISRHRATLGGIELELPRGRTLGGSGAVNGGYCAPARPSDLAAWGPDWPGRYAVGLARATERLRPRLVPAGHVAARVAAAFPGRVSAVAQARRGGRRVTAFDAWDPAGAGARVVTGAMVRELKWAGGHAGGRCDGVVLDDDEEITARLVILCAGSIGSAAVLLGSGIAPDAGYPVGRGTQEHPEVLLELPAGGTPGGRPPETGAEPGAGRNAAGGVDALPPLLSHVVRLELPTASGIGEFEVRPYSLPLHRVIPGLSPQPHRIGVALMNPVGRGEIVRDGGLRVVLADDPGDAAALHAAAGLVADRLGIAGPAGGPRPGPGVSTSHHLSGSARIGEVVDESGRVLGCEGLRVADASVFPSLPRCGPYMSVLAVAEDLAARMISEGAW